MPRKTVLITGASAGIGAACARMAAARGYDIVMTYNNDEASANIVADAARASGAQVQVFQCDVADPEAIDALFSRIDRLDALINNAGIVDQAAKVTEFTHARLRRMFDVNVIGAMLFAKEAVLRMPEGGAIINISSVAAKLGSGGQYVDYAASKAAIDTFNKGLSDEVAAHGIRVIAVRPGIIDTEIHAKGGQPGRADKIGPTVPIGRKGTPEEIAETVLWLMSDAASYITGTTIDVSGGR